MVDFRTRELLAHTRRSGGPEGRCACNEVGCRAQADDHGIILDSKTRPSRSARASFFRHLESIIAVADIDRAVGAPFPAAVKNVEMMAMAVMTMTMMMTMAMPVMAAVVAVASTVPTVAAMPTVTVTASESLTGDGQ